MKSRARYCLIMLALLLIDILAEFRITRRLASIVLPVVARETISYWLDKYHESHSPESMIWLLKSKGYTDVQVNGDTTTLTYPGLPGAGKWTFRTVRKQ